MKIDTRGSGRSPNSSSFGGTASATRLTRPSAGATRSPSRSGVTRAGSRKKYAHQSVATNPNQPSGGHSQNNSRLTSAGDNEAQALAVDRRQLGADGGKNR